jgi:uncharacterized membrane protein
LTERRPPGYTVVGGDTRLTEPGSEARRAVNDYLEQQRPLPKNAWNERPERPHIRPPMTRAEVIAIAITLAGLTFTVVPLAIWWSSLPDTIPSHFGLNGRPDAYGPKTTLLIFPVVALAVTVLFQTLCRFPWIFNYPVRITAANAERQYVAGRTLLRWVNAIVWVFAGVQWESLQIARGVAQSFSPLFTAGLIAVAILTPITILIMVVVWIVRSR